jgi:pimeloyl-ACP methyl ester carboxylesterase
VVILPSYGRDGGDEFDSLAVALAGAGYRVLRPQPRGIGRSTGPGAGAAPVFEIIAERDPFHQKDEWGDLRSEFGPRFTSP